MQHVTEKKATHICDVDKVKIIDNYQIVESKSKKKKNINNVNLSNCCLTTDKVSVLEPWLSLCPTTKYLHKDNYSKKDKYLNNAFHIFIRRLKIFEYFQKNSNLQDSQDTSNDVDLKRDILDWRKRNPDWYTRKTIRRTCIIH